MKKLIPELEAIKSDRLMLWLAIFTLPLFSSNTYFIYHKLSVLPDPWRDRVALGVAFILAGFVIVYTLRKNYRMAKYFAYFEALISAYYYITTIKDSWDLIPALGFTLILPAALYHCAREIAKEKIDDMISISDVERKLDEQNATISNLERTLQDAEIDRKYFEDLANKNQVAIDHLVQELSAKNEIEISDDEMKFIDKNDELKKSLENHPFNVEVPEESKKLKPQV